jgi:hypothetical protein
VLRLATWLADPRAALQRRRSRAARSGRVPVATPPYDLGRYDALLAGLRAYGATPIAFADPACPGGAAFVIRHDIDTPDCVANAPRLLDVNERHGCAPAVFIRCDGLDYDPQTAVPLVELCRRDGVPVGLHTSAYAFTAEPLRKLADERVTFERLFGEPPRLLTVHGIGATAADSRRRLVDDITARMGDLGLEFHDASPALRSYAHVFEDCHVDPANGERRLLSDFKDPEGFVGRGAASLVLTHPCYWG